MARSRPPNRVSGTSSQAIWLNQLLEYCTSLDPQESPGLLTDHTTRGVSRRPRPQEPGARGGSTQFVLKAVKEDYYLCLPWDSSQSIPADVALDSTSLVKVAKPFELRVADWDEFTVEGWTYHIVVTSPYQGIRRHAIRESDDKLEIQEVVPHYLNDCLIYADEPTGGTGAIDEANAPITWSDTNRAGRIFCKTTVRITEDDE